MSGLQSMVWSLTGLIEESRLTYTYSRRLLQPDQPSLRIHHRVLLTSIMSRDEGHRRVSAECPQEIAEDCAHRLYRFEYLWQDSENFKKPTKMSAPQYIEHLMVWCQANIDNEQQFPSKIGTVLSAFDSISQC